MLKFVTGMLCGVGIGLLIAPESGERTRRRLKRVVEEPEQIVTSVREKAGDMGANLGRQAAQKAFDRVVPEKFSPGERRSG